MADEGEEEFPAAEGLVPEGIDDGRVVEATGAISSLRSEKATGGYFKYISNGINGCAARRIEFSELPAHVRTVPRNISGNFHLVLGTALPTFLVLISFTPTVLVFRTNPTTFGKKL